VLSAQEQCTCAGFSACCRRHKQTAALTQLLHSPQGVGTLPHPAAHCHDKRVVQPLVSQPLLQICTGREDEERVQQGWAQAPLRARA
jgi:hypothetical protein